MEGILGSFGLVGIMVYVAFIILWLLVPIFIFVITRRVKEIRDVARDSQLEIMELNANIKFIKEKYSEKNEQLVQPTESESQNL
ncbi:hypothetical protein Patl_1412 [Paraglaciecola sp. T6c]|uniref:hypothetical protein n=1 Tax=Pseudoalteromonas atlantica (strain T6c / ATCC BAA-1087) TaxID=3042615 RepID=UPI00005C670E|nr:hypothetical protein [Paraglaciecola sp. T6c]ABG39937.1 hypothetical protein Patl_1412 [Paraglaciecola sp. T6c]